MFCLKFSINLKTSDNMEAQIPYLSAINMYILYNMAKYQVGGGIWYYCNIISEMNHANFTEDSWNALKDFS